jgi:hypothetical protein
MYFELKSHLPVDTKQEDLVFLFAYLIMGLDSFWTWVYFNTTIHHYRRILTGCNKDLENANFCLQVARLYSSGLSIAMVCSMKWVTILMLFTHLATRVIVAKVRSLAVLTFQSRTWGKWTLHRQFFNHKVLKILNPSYSNASLVFAGCYQIVL